MASERIISAMDFESDTKNWKYPFKKLTKSYGREFIEIVKVMWEANDGCQSIEEFCEMNSINIGFFNNVINKNK